jgi:hypothetical protein
VPPNSRVSRFGLILLPDFVLVAMDCFLIRVFRVFWGGRTKFNRATWVGRNLFVRPAKTNNIRATLSVIIELDLGLT